MAGVSEAAARGHRLVSRLIFSASVWERAGPELSMPVLCRRSHHCFRDGPCVVDRTNTTSPRSAATCSSAWPSRSSHARSAHAVTLRFSRGAPTNADVWIHATSPLRTPAPEYAPLTLDPVNTRVEVLRGLTYLAIFLATLRLAHRQSGADFCATLLVGTAVLLGVAALLHPAFGMTKVFGLYRPTTPIPERHIGPILNANALAAYLNVGFCISLARA